MGSLLNSNEQAWFDDTALEVLTLAGTETPILWKFSPTGNATLAQMSGVSGLIDCLYSEPKMLVPGQQNNKLKVYTPYNVLCFFERPSLVIDATDSGLSKRTEGKFWFSRKNLEDIKVPMNASGYHVEPGDIVELWSTFKKISWYFEIINAERDGFEHDSRVWTHYECDAIRNDNFSPERKMP